MFKVSDEVIIRHDLDTSHGSKYLLVTDEMQRMAGMKAVVMDVNIGNDKVVYDLDIDGGCFGWLDSMLEMV